MSTQLQTDVLNLFGPRPGDIKIRLKGIIVNLSNYSHLCMVLLEMGLA